MKLANLVAIETGILIGLLAWMVYSRLPAPEQLDKAEGVAKTPTQVTSAAPMAEQRTQRPYVADDGGYRDRAPQPMANQNVPTYNQPYYQPVYQPAVTVPDYGSATDTSAYTPDQEPVTAPVEYVAPYPVYYSEPVQTVIIANSRSFRDRRDHRLMHHSSGVN